MFKRIEEHFQYIKQRLSSTIFTRYLLVTSLVIIISCTVLGLVLLTFVSDQWQNEKQKLLSDNALNIADLARRTYSRVTEEDENGQTRTIYIVNEEVNNVLSVVGNSIEADIFIVNLSGETVLCSENSFTAGRKCKHQQHIFSSAFIETVLNQKTDFRTTGTLDGIYEDDNYIVGIPITAVDETGQENQIGVIFAATSAEMMSDFRGELMRVFLIAIILASVLCVLAVYVLTYRMIRPLRQMAAATHAFAIGDFSKRVPVNSEDEIGQLAESFNNMASSLSSSEMMHRSFVANVSHELKTPMTSISGFVHGMLDGVIPPEKHPYYLEKVAQEADRLARLVRAMLDLSKVDSGAMQIHKSKFDLTEAIFRTVISFEQKISEKQIEIRGAEDMEPFFVNGDPDLLHQVIYNLFENAVKFVNSGGYIELSLRESGNIAYFRIRNSGAGIDPEELNRVFERFYKTDRSRGLDKTGVGLGLYLVKTIVTLHGGSVEVRSIVGEYTEFEFYIQNN